MHPPILNATMHRQLLRSTRHWRAAHERMMCGVSFHLENVPQQTKSLVLNISARNSRPLWHSKVHHERLATAHTICFHLLLQTSSNRLHSFSPRWHLLQADALASPSKHANQSSVFSARIFE
jgi:hypothetical protein